ncbi:MAG: hypothetical protein HPY61_07450 [Methanotrichaceae archaeon]|nr:hypothetical protein [Methanotrichaceae archaeon]
MVDFAGPMQARLAAFKAAIVFEKDEADDIAQSKQVLRYFWPGPVVVVFSEGPLGVMRRVEMAWRCLFGRNVKGLCYEPPEWALEKNEMA